jgi:hypothetical protein
MQNSDSRGEWNEERLYVLRTLEDLKAEQKKQAETAAADRASLIDRAARDISAAHDKIRRLENSSTTLRLKNWVMLAVILAGFELAKALLHGWKP